MLASSSLTRAGSATAQRTVARLRSLALAFLLLVVSAAPRAADEPVVLNFVNAEIDAVVKAVSDITGRNFILDPKVKGTINIISARAVPRSLVYPTLLSALRLQGWAAIESGNMTKIVPEADAKQHGSSVSVGAMPPAGGDRLVTQVFQLQHESAVQMVPVLRPLITPNNSVAAFAAANALVITDYADNLRRIARIVAALDQPSMAEPVIIPLQHASAIDIAQTVTRLVVEGPSVVPTPAQAVAGGEPGQRTAVIAEPQSNSLLVRADSPARLARIRAFVEQLDVPSRAGSNIRIVYLRNAEAVRVAQTLRAVLTGAAPGAPVAVGTQAASVAAPAPMTLTQQAAAVLTSAAGASYPGGGSGAGSGNGPLPPPIIVGGATIQADPATNALVISAPESIYNNLREVIDKLDVRRAQVYIEALIAEVRADRAAEFGIQWQFLDSTSLDPNYSGSGRGAGGTNFGDRGSGSNIFDAMTNLGAAGKGLNVGVIKGTVTIPGIGAVLNLSVLLRALEADGNANILSMPNLLTLDNETAQVVIGQNIPIQTGSYQTPGSGGIIAPQLPFQTYERRDIGLVLRVKPQITEGGTVKMQIYQEVSNIVDPATLFSPGGAITTKRALESTVLVDDGQIVVLGGLLQDSLTDSAEKVPVLGDIPVLGQLFRYDTRARAKTNLMVFLRPQVLRTASGSQTISRDRYDYILGEQLRAAPEDRFFWRDPTIPMTPPLPGTQPAPAAAPGQSAPPRPAVPAPQGAAPGTSPYGLLTPPRQVGGTPPNWSSDPLSDAHRP